MVIMPCATCGQNVKIPPSKIARKQSGYYCSNACRFAGRSFERACEHCGKTFHAYKSEEGRARFCSAGCRNSGVGAKNVKLHERVCKVCHQPFTLTGSEIRRKTCSPACATIARAKHKKGSKVTHNCVHCGKTFQAFPSRAGRFCSRKCSSEAGAARVRGTIRTSRIVSCAYCGKSIKQYKSRTHYHNKFCGAECYHSWDSWYKSQPEQQRKHAARMMRTVETKTSKIEDAVAQWLDDHGVAYERQISLIHRSMDFGVANAYIEVQGCYWHGCPQCYILQTPRQRKTMARDKAKATYCRRRGIPLYIIWEHDIRRSDFTALEHLLATIRAP